MTVASQAEADALRGHPPCLPSAPLWRRMAAMVYESLLVAALVLLTGLAVQLLASLGGLAQPDSGWRLAGANRLLLQASITVAIALYFSLSWRRGQTLAMRAWRLRLETTHGTLPSGRRALLRLALIALLVVPATVASFWLIEHPRDWAGRVALMPLAAALLWSLIDRDRQAVFDRLAGTRLVLLPAANAARSATS